MHYRQIIFVTLGMVAVRLAAFAAELPLREKIEKDGWTIEFSPMDRAVAEQLAGRVADFERIQASDWAGKIELEPAVIHTRAGAFAEQMAELCALPNHTGDFQKEIQRMLPTVVELLADFRKAVTPRALSIVRKSELIQRIKAGEKIPLFSYDAATNLVNFQFGLNYSIDKDYKITQRPEPLAALPLRLREDEKAGGDPAEALMKDFQETSRTFASMAGQMYGKMLVAISFNTVIANALASEFPETTRAQWIKSGATQWMLRRFLVAALNPEQAEGYLWYHEQQLQNAFKNTQSVNLEENPGKLTELQQALAYAVFRTIAEKHGNAAVTKLLAEFWRVKPEKRSSEAFDKICRKQLKQPLAAYLPRGAVIAPVSERPKK